MASFAAIDSVVSLCPPKHSWKIKVRVVHKWIPDSFSGDNKPSTLELLFLDQYGGKIQGTVRKLMFRKWSDVFVEGNVYLISFFHLIPNMGSYRATDHGFRILFNTKTSILPADSSVIPRFGFTFKNSEYLNADGAESEYLVDMLGLLTARSEERTYVKEGVVTKMMLLEISDNNGKVECAVFGDYVQTVVDYLAAYPLEKPIIIFQRAKLKTFRGKNVLQNVMKASRIFFNPQIAEAASFMELMAGIDLEVEKPVGHMVMGNPILPMSEDFIQSTPRKTIAELNATSEDGFYIVLAKVVGLLQEDQWWYFACKCHKAVTFVDGLYYCAGCCKHVLDVSARYRIKLEVFDDSDSGSFLMFDSDAQHLLKKSCKDMLLEVKDPMSGECTPLMEKMLVGRELLFKVEKRANNFYQFDDSLRIKRICDEAAIIDAFKAAIPVQTPVVLTFVPAHVAGISGQELEAANSASQLSDVLSPENLTPFLGAGPSDDASAANRFKRKTKDGLDNAPVVTKLKTKQVKKEKE